MISTTERPAGSPEVVEAPSGGPGRSGTLKVGWPLAVIFVPFPLWWALGMTEFICILMAVPMAAQLVRRRRVEAHRGFGFWLFFLAWVAVGVAVLHVDAVGAVADNSPTRYLTWFYRLLWYLTVTVVLLYVLNNRRSLSTLRLSRILSFGFLTVVAGGLLGVLAPSFQFPSLMELVLPQGLVSNGFVYNMIHPSAAQLQDVLGYQAPRPSAPFSYSNIWGLNYACLVPFFCYGWWQGRQRWRRVLLPVVLLVSAVPVIYSINRGLWAALVVMTLFIAIRAAVMGRPAALAGVLAGGMVVAALLAFTSLGGVVGARFSNDGSEQGRTNLGTLSVVSVTSTAPVTGLGSTRSVQGNFNTITGGATPACPRCSPPALGTQGQLWLVIFSQGLVGLGLYLAYFGLVFLRHLRQRSPEATLGLTVLVASFVTMPVYNALGTGLLAVMVAVAILHRSDLRTGIAGSRPAPALADYLRPLVDQRILVTTCLLVGIGGGIVWQRAHGTPYLATVRVLLPAESKHPAPEIGPMTIDSQARLLASARVADAVEKATGDPLPPDATTLSVKALPNSRVLDISYRSDSPRTASVGVDAAVRALMANREERLARNKAQELKRLDRTAMGYASSIDTLNSVLGGLETSGGAPVPLAETYNLRESRSELLTEMNQLNYQYSRAVGTPVWPGTVLRGTMLMPVNDVWRVSVLSGLMLGFLAGGCLAVWRCRDGLRLRTREQLFTATGLPILGAVHVAARRPVPRRQGPGPDLVDDAEAARAARVLASFDATGVVASGSQGRVVALAARLDQELLLGGAAQAPRVRPSPESLHAVVVTEPGVRAGELERCRRSLAAVGVHVLGLMVVDKARRPAG